VVSFHALTPGRGARRTDAERAAWWSDASGIPPGAGVAIVDARATEAIPRCRAALPARPVDRRRRAAAGAVRAASSTRAALPRRDCRIVLIHGVDDGLVPEAFSGAPYAAGQAEGRDLRYWRVRNAQHFDAFLACRHSAPATYRCCRRLPRPRRDAGRTGAGQGAADDADIETRKRALPHR
jgi:hydroxybutyrate-dimer hydrolase